MFCLAKVGIQKIVGKGSKTVRDSVLCYPKSVNRAEGEERVHYFLLITKKKHRKLGKEKFIWFIVCGGFSL